LFIILNLLIYFLVELLSFVTKFLTRKPLKDDPDKFSTKLSTENVQKQQEANSIHQRFFLVA